MPALDRETLDAVIVRLMELGLALPGGQEASAKTSTDSPPASASVNALDEARVDPEPQVDPQAPSDLEDWVCLTRYPTFNQSLLTPPPPPSKSNGPMRRPEQTCMRISRDPALRAESREDARPLGCFVELWLCAGHAAVSVTAAMDDFNNGADFGRLPDDDDDGDGATTGKG
ncbi:hypothetical protein BDZ89DRAFT_1113094 [Hymenopellis radicata]|nr:hypothetical protein BDZ89DRAFT_1113094 [Hymenopellis radicata]